jgi:monoamine oxidase
MSKVKVLSVVSVLLLIGGGFFAIYSSQLDDKGAKVDKSERIVVVGGGMSGISAARQLTDDGYTNVTVLEAKDKIGGRITSTNFAGSLVELGAQWVHGNENNPIVGLLEQAKLESAVTDYDNAKEFAAGEEVDSGAYETIIREFYTAAESQPDTPLSDVFTTFISNNSITDDANQYLRYSISATVEHELAADWTTVSFSSFDVGEEIQGEDLFVKGGYENTVNYLARGLNIKLNHTVTGVDYSASPVKVSVKDQPTIEADRVIITVSLGVLKRDSISFTPTLPDANLTAIKQLGFGVLDKTYLLFEEPFWDTSTTVFGFVGEANKWTETYNLLPVTGKPMLVMFNAGSYAKELEAMTDQEIVAQAMERLRQNFANVSEPKDYLITRWNTDPSTWGSYSYLPAGVSDDMYRQLAQPVDEKVFFAGEATDPDYPATVQGAYQSGIRVAKEISGL